MTYAESWPVLQTPARSVVHPRPDLHQGPAPWHWLVSEVTRGQRIEAAVRCLLHDYHDESGCVVAAIAALQAALYRGEDLIGETTAPPTDEREERG